jgi:bacterioferritin-associated ferredoxin
MEVIQICPKCNGLGVKVENLTVKNIVRQEFKKEIDDDSTWYICSSKDCSVVYFSGKRIYSKSDVKVKVWFKEKPTEEVPICYCSNLTNHDIINVIKNGCNSIKDVQDYTNKNITGKCRYKNPLGKCCRDVFLSVLNQSEESSVRSCCCDDK